MTHDGRTGDDEPGTLLFGDDDEELDTAAFDPEPAPPPIDDLRYAGPINVDDSSDEEGDPYVETSSGAGKVLFTAGLIGGMIVVLFGAALYFRSGAESAVGEPTSMAPVRSAAATPQSAAPLSSRPEPSMPVEPGAAPSTSPPPTLAAAASKQPASIVPTPPSAPIAAPQSREATASAALDRRPLPVPATETGTIKPKGSTVPAPTKAASLPPSTTREQPRPASLVGTRSTPATTGGSGASAREPNAPSKAPVASARGHFDLASRVAQSRSELSVQAAGGWTVQLMVACQSGSVEKAFGTVHDPALRVLDVSHQGQSCYRLLWGLYRDEAAARAARVPPYFAHSGTPKAVKIDSLLAR